MVRIDVRELREGSLRSEGGEAFQTVHRQREYRIGAGARVPSTFFVEVLVDPFPDGRVDIDHLDRCLVLLRSLQEGGYALGCSGDRTVCGELMVKGTELEKKVAAAMEWGRTAFQM